MTLASTPATINVHALKASCSACSMHQLCLPMGLGEADISKLDQIIGRRRKVLESMTLPVLMAH